MVDSIKKITRRNFFKTSGLIGAGALMNSTALAVLPGENPNRIAANETVPTRPFGKTGIQVSILSMGGMYDIPSNQLMLRQALNMGVTYWDTANSYEGGRSEKGFGQFFEKYPEERKRIFLVTKSGAWTLSGIERDLDLSLERMKTDTIDLFFIHGISSIGKMDEDIRKWADSMKSKGKIRLIGFSTHSNMAECLMEASRLGWIDGIMMTYNFRNMHDSDMKRAVDACAKAGIGLTAMKTQGGGPVRTDTEAELRMAGHFMKKGFTDPQAKLKAVWENPNIASICSQMPSMSILMANIAAALDKTRLSSHDMKLLQEYADATSCGYCTGCSNICEPLVRGNPPIGDTMRYLMYQRSYGDKERAKALFAEMNPGMRRRLPVLDYAEAEKRCPQNIPIARLMKEAVIELAS